MGVNGDDKRQGAREWRIGGVSISEHATEEGVEAVNDELDKRAELTDRHVSWS